MVAAELGRPREGGSSTGGVSTANEPVKSARSKKERFPANSCVTQKKLPSTHRAQIVPAVHRLPE